MYEEIKKIISSKNSSIDNQTLVYFTNYFYCLVKDNLIPQKIKLESLIDNTMKCVCKVEFYDENCSNKKWRVDLGKKTIFVRNNIAEPLREITIYHILHHLVQTNPHSKGKEVGINHEGYTGRLILEAQTQYFAEKIYQEIYGVSFEERQIPTENLRMAGNGIVISKLHDHETYDNLLSKLAIMLDVSKDYFVSINFLYENNEGLKDLETKYNEAKKKYKLPYRFEEILILLDHCYYVDSMTYLDYRYYVGSDNLDKDTISRLQSQREYINKFDIDNFWALVESDGNFKEFGRLVIDCEKRKLVSQFIDMHCRKKRKARTYKRK